MYPPVTRKNVYQALELPPRQSIPNSALQIILKAQEHSVENENVSDDRLYTFIIFSVDRLLISTLMNSFV
jgi:hypothetical protein